MTRKVESVTKEILEKISPSEEEMGGIRRILEKFLSKARKNIKRSRIDADIFIGGSYAKGTLIRKKSYDVDIFLRLGKRYKEEEYPKISKKVLSRIKGISVSHGSRDYFKVNISSSLFFEIVPVKRIKSPKEAQNVTDLSYLHVNYIKKNVKDRKVIEGIKLAKAFCYATKTYGAESYIKGFSGYSLELLVDHFGGFEKLLRALSKKSNEKTVIDIEKHYKKKDVLMDMNGSKLDSPIILVDPTYRERNALAGLSKETFERFKKYASKFLKSPSKKFFEQASIDFSRIPSPGPGKETLIIELATRKEKGDIAGTKLLKFFNHLERELSRDFKILKKDFEYYGEKTGKGYFILKSRREVILTGPKKDDAKNVSRFKKEHISVFVKNSRVYAKKRIDFSPAEFIKDWSGKNKKKMEEMSITQIKVI